jgi:serine O-acetyltransferase
MIFSLIVKKIGGYNGLRRKYNNTKFNSLKKIFKILNRLYNYESNAYIPFNNIIHGEINFPHGISGVFISGDSVIGSNCTIYHQITIGSNTLIGSKTFGSPKLGDNILIGAGAKIIGRISIGDNVRIGANAVVTNDIPDNCIVVNGNQTVIQKDQLNNRIYQKSVNGWGYMKDGSFIKETNTDIINSLN